MNPSILLSLIFAGTLAGCNSSPVKDVDPSQTAVEKGRVVANDTLAAVERDTDRARLSTLEKQVDTLSAKLDASDVTVLEGRIAALEAKTVEPVAPSPSEFPSNGAVRTPTNKDPGP